MKHVKVILVVALLTASFTTRAQEAQKTQFDFGGWLVTGAFQDRGQFDSRELPRYVAAEPAIQAQSTGYLVRQSRLRFGVTVPTDNFLAGVTMKGFVEADFMGGATVPATGLAENAANPATVDPVVPRLRHAYFSATWKQVNNLTLTVGQTWGVSMGPPANWASSLTHLAVPRFGGAGFLYRRAPQVRLSVDVPAGPLNVYVAAGALTAGDIASATSNSPGGNQSYIPNVEGRIAGQYKASGPVRFVEVGLNGHYGQERWTTDPASAAALNTAVTASNQMYGVDGKIDFGMVALVGGLFQGQNLDNYNSIAGLLRTGTATTRYGLLLDLTNPNDPKAREVKTQGAWAQVQVTPVKYLQVLAGLGFENPDDSTLSLPGAAVANNTILRNTQYSAAVLWSITSKWRISVEGTRYITLFRGPQNDTITGNQFEIGSLLAI